MRILHVSDSYLPRLGGIELHLHDLVARQRALGHQVSIATGTTTEPDDPPAEAELVVRLPRFVVVPTREARFGLSRLIDTGAYDVVHTHSSLVSPLAWLAARAAATAGIPAVLTMHSLAPEGPGGRALGAALQAVPPVVAWTAVSTAAAVALSRVLGGREVTVLPNGIDPADWVPRTSRPADQPATIVSVMRTARRKRPLPLLQILAALRRELPADRPLRAVLVGSGPLDGAVRRQIDGSELRTWVTHTGRLDRSDIRTLLEHSDLYLAPATNESFGIAALEARCAGVPVIGMARGGLGDFIRPGLDGFLVDSDAAMSAQAAQLLDDPVRLDQMQRQLRATSPLTTWPRVLEQHWLAYRAAGARGASPAVTGTGPTVVSDASRAAIVSR